MGVHTGAVIHEDGFGHHRDRLAMLSSHVLHHVLVQHNLVAHPGERAVAHVDLGLTSGADLVMVDLHCDADALERLDHLRTKVLHVIHRWGGEVALLVAWLVAKVGSRLVSGVPKAFDRVDVVEALVVRLIEPDVVEYVELDLGSPIARVRDP